MVAGRLPAAQPMLGGAHAPPPRPDDDQAQDASAPGCSSYNDGRDGLSTYRTPCLAAPETEPITGLAPSKGNASLKPYEQPRESMEQQGGLQQRRGLHDAKDVGIVSVTAEITESGSDSNAACTPELSTRQLQALLQALMAASLLQHQQSYASTGNTAGMDPCLSGPSAEASRPQSSQRATTGSQSSTLCDNCRCTVCSMGSSESDTCSTLCIDCRNAELVMQRQPPPSSDDGRRHIPKDVTTAESSPPMQHTDVQEPIPESPVSPRQAELLARLQWLRQADRATSMAAGGVFAKPLDHSGSKPLSAGRLAEDPSSSEGVSHSESRRRVLGNSALLWEEMQTRTRHARSLRLDNEGAFGPEAHAQRGIPAPRHPLHRLRSSMPSAGRRWQHVPAGKGTSALHIVGADCLVSGSVALHNSRPNHEHRLIAGASLAKPAVKPVGQQSKAQALRGLAESR